jgi:ATP-dependent Clp protease adapter protein ClpS
MHTMPITICQSKNAIIPPNKITSTNQQIHSPSSSPKPNITQIRQVILYGGPYKNKDTMTQLLQDCVKGISEEKAKVIVEEAHLHTQATIITCKENEAYVYCQNLIENGLLVKIE